MGLLDRTRDGQAIDPFPAGKGVYTTVRENLKHFTYDSRRGQLHTMCAAVGCAHLKPAIDLSQTRIAGANKLFATVKVQV